MQQKPLGRKNYGHIPYLPGSRMGPGDHKCHEGQARIATAKVRDKNDEIFVQEKLTAPMWGWPASAMSFMRWGDPGMRPLVPTRAASSLQQLGVCQP